MNWVKLDTQVYLFIAALCILIQSVTLIKLVRSGKYKQGIIITAILIISNTSQILYYVIAIKFN